MPKIEEKIGNAAAKLAKDIEADVILSLERKEEDQTDFTEPTIRCVISTFRKTQKGYIRNSYTGKIKKSTDASIFPIKEVVMEAISKDLIKKDDKVVCIIDEGI